MIRVLPVVAELGRCLEADKYNTTASTAVGKAAASNFNFARLVKRLILVHEHSVDTRARRSEVTNLFECHKKHFSVPFLDLPTGPSS